MQIIAVDLKSENRRRRTKGVGELLCLPISVHDDDKATSPVYGVNTGMTSIRPLQHTPNFVRDFYNFQQTFSTRFGRQRRW